MANVNWSNVVSAVATEEGLLVTERGMDGMVGASPRLLPSQKRVAPGDATASMSCTDAALKTYRFVKVPRQTNAGYVETPTPPFKACSDQDAWKILLYTVMDEAWCVRLERLDAKPGYVSQWVKLGNNCGEYLPVG